MTYRIRFRYPRDYVLVNRTQVGHHKDLFLGFFVPLIRQQKAEATDAILEELETPYAEWAVSEILSIGYISLYHLWERQIISLARDQLYLHSVTLRSRRRNETFTEYVREFLREYFQAELNEKIWMELDKARVFTNAYKHEFGEKLRQLHQRWPEFFPGAPESPSDDALAAALAITEEEFKLFHGSLDKFWDQLPYDIDYRKI